jgi:hypothetical protein
MRFVKRSPAEIEAIIAKCASRHIVGVNTQRTLVTGDEHDRGGWKAQVIITTQTQIQPPFEFVTDWLFATQTDAANWGRWLAAVWLEEDAERRGIDLNV